MMMKEKRLRAIIVDDEEPARRIIREYLEEYPEVEIAGEGKSGTEGIELVNRTEPDLLFLDIQMPGKTGFELLEELARPPSIIFCTAYDQHAIRAFEVNAVDYLLKPFTRERFREAVTRVIAQKRSLDMGQLSLLIETWQHHRKEEERPFLVRSGNRFIPINPDDIIRVEATGDYSTLYTASASYLCNERLKEMEGRLDVSRFIRIHRSTIIALRALHYLVPNGDGGYTAHLVNGLALRVSRSYGAELKKRLL